MKNDSNEKNTGTSPVTESPAERLLRWYDANRRILPWREDPTPYHVWLSEIMLQQTRVEAVRDYYTRFLAALPTIESLAKADEDVYLKLWEGLGYYSRVRNLHKAANQILAEHGGRMPRTYEALLKLAGIGPYTASAIASICYDARIPAVDGNLLRVFARMTGYDGSIKADAAKSAAREYYLTIFPESRCGDMNQALMDLGACICLPAGAPLCGECPWAELCTARSCGLEQELPVVPAKKRRLIEEKTVFLIYYNQKLALRKRPEHGLLAGLYEFPNAPGTLDRDEAVRFARDLGFTALRLQKLPAAKHIFSHREWHMTGWQILADEWEPFAEGSPREHELFLADARQLSDVYSIPSAFGKYQKEIRMDYL
ncbi:MAG: A/G-specific adenine glycosylase [Firmicutes bacterium]|nr:A/G-specific adenine glycosylase [Bacillota bacterium]